jgi:hypothetical protein
VEVQNLDGQPLVKVWLAGAEFTKNADSLNSQPDIRYEPQNLKGMSAYGPEFWGDSGAPIRVNGSGVRAIPRAEDSGGEVRKALRR